MNEVHAPIESKEQREARAERMAQAVFAQLAMTHQLQHAAAAARGATCADGMPLIVGGLVGVLRFAAQGAMDVEELRNSLLQNFDLNVAELQMERAANVRMQGTA